MGPLKRFPNRQRAIVKVQDGCDAFCAYCIVPYTRPVVWSRDVGRITAECEALVAAGHREIVLSGVFLGAYGRQTALRRQWGQSEAPLTELIRAVAEIEGLWRLRLSSLEPADLTDDLLGLWRDLPNLAPHFHLPLQSGSSRVLQRMNRQYTAEEYCRTVEHLHGALDRPALTTDIIVGFPGESDGDFDQTISVARQAGFSKIHTFPFSAIEGTAAWSRRSEAPPAEEVKARMARLGALEADMAAAYRCQFVGDVLEGVVEGARARRDRPQSRQAMTDRYLTVRFGAPRENDLTGQVVSLRIAAATKTGLRGTLIS